MLKNQEFNQIEKLQTENYNFSQKLAWEEFQKISKFISR